MKVSDKETEHLKGNRQVPRVPKVRTQVRIRKLVCLGTKVGMTFVSMLQVQSVFQSLWGVSPWSGEQSTA